MLPYNRNHLLPWQPTNYRAVNDMMLMEHGGFHDPTVTREAPPVPHAKYDQYGGYDHDNRYDQYDRQDQYDRYDQSSPYPVDRNDIEGENDVVPGGEICIEIGGGGRRVAGRDITVRIKMPQGGGSDYQPGYQNVQRQSVGIDQ